MAAVLVDGEAVERVSATAALPVCHGKSAWDFQNLLAVDDEDHFGAEGTEDAAAEFETDGHVVDYARCVGEPEAVRSPVNS